MDANIHSEPGKRGQDMAGEPCASWQPMLTLVAAGEELDPAEQDRLAAHLAGRYGLGFTGAVLLRSLVNDVYELAAGDGPLDHDVTSLANYYSTSGTPPGRFLAAARPRSRAEAPRSAAARPPGRIHSALSTVDQVTA